MNNYTTDFYAHGLLWIYGYPYCSQHPYCLFCTFYPNGPSLLSDNSNMSNNNSNSNNNQEKDKEEFDHPLEYYLVPTLDDKKLAAADKLREFNAKTQCSWCGFPLQGSKFFQMHRIKGGKEKAKYCSLPCVNAIIEQTGGNSIGRLVVTAEAYNAPMVEASKDFTPLIRLNSNGLKFAPGEKHVTYAEFFKARLPAPEQKKEEEKKEESNNNCKKEEESVKMEEDESPGFVRLGHNTSNNTKENPQIKSDVSIKDMITGHTVSITGLPADVKVEELHNYFYLSTGRQFVRYALMPMMGKKNKMSTSALLEYANHEDAKAPLMDNGMRYSVGGPVMVITPIDTPITNNWNVSVMKNPFYGEPSQYERNCPCCSMEKNEENNNTNNTIPEKKNKEKKSVKMEEDEKKPLCDHVYTEEYFDACKGTQERVYDECRKCGYNPKTAPIDMSDVTPWTSSWSPVEFCKICKKGPFGTTFEFSYKLDGKEHYISEACQLCTRAMMRRDPVSCDASTWVKCKTTAYKDYLALGLIDRIENGKWVDPKRKREEPASDNSNNNKQAKVEEEEEKFIQCEQGECKNNASAYYTEGDYTNHYFCKSCKPNIPKGSDVTTFGSDQIPESQREEDVIRCQWTDGCKNPCVNWAYKKVPEAMRGEKRRFYCKDCHQP